MSRSADPLPATFAALLALEDGHTAESTAGPTDLASAIARLAGHPAPRPALIDAAIAATGAERGFFVVRKDEGWEAPFGRTFEGEDVLNPLDKVILPLVERCLERGEGFITHDLCADPAWPSLERQRTPRTRALRIAPLPDGAGVLYLDHRFQGWGGDPDPAALAAIIALFAWLAVREERSRTVELLQEELRRARAETRGRSTGARTGRGDAGKAALHGPAIIGEHPDILEIQTLIDRVAPSDAPVLITGESGTGKELVARAIHARSPRSAGPFVSENCGAITETLLESELFGCVKGAYTGADEDRPGLFELASGGTIFLDEIGDTSPALQKKLLRVLQEGVVRRVGGGDEIPVEVRVLSATNRDLYREVQAGNFREDLFYRLNVINIQLPSLRDRREDIPLLAEHFVRELNERSGQEKEVSPEWVEALLAHQWPGNIRELQNEVRRCHALSGRVLDPAHLSPRVGGAGKESATALTLDSVLETGSLKDALDSFEKKLIETALKRYRGNRARVCETLAIPKTTLYAKIRRYGLE